MTNIVNNKSKLFLPFVLLAIFVISLIFFQPTVSAQSSCQGPPTISSTNLFDVPLQGSAIACESAPQTAITVTSPIPISITLNGGLMDGNDDPFGVGHVYSTLSQTVINMCPSDNFAPVLNVQLSPAVIGEVSVNVRPGTGSYTVTTNDDQSITQFINGGSSANFTFTSTSTEGISSLTVTPAGPVIPGAGFAFGIAGFSISTFSTPPPAPVTGTITPDPLSACPGTSVNVTGEGWVTPDGMNNSFILLFDGQQVAQQGPGIGCLDQPNLTFTVPANATPGDHTLTLQAPQGSASTVFTVEGLNSGLFPNAISCGQAPDVIFQYADGRPLPSPFRIGKSSKNDKGVTNRSVMLRAIFSPNSSLKEINIVSRFPKTIKIKEDMRDNVAIFFTISGEIPSDTAGPEDFIQAVHKKDGLIGQVMVRIVVPFQIAPRNHDVIGRNGLEIANLAQNETTSPADFNVNKNNALLVTYYQRFLKVQLVDQFGEPLDDIYKDAVIMELTNKGYRSINQRLMSDGTYHDPVGIVVGSKIVKFDSDEARQWKNQPSIPPLANDMEELQNITVRIDDDFVLKVGVVNRLVRYRGATENILVNWPDYK